MFSMLEKYQIKTLICLPYPRNITVSNKRIFLNFLNNELLIVQNNQERKHWKCNCCSSCFLCWIEIKFKNDVFIMFDNCGKILHSTFMRGKPNHEKKKMFFHHIDKTTLMKKYVVCVTTQEYTTKEMCSLFSSLQFPDRYGMT